MCRTIFGSQSNRNKIHFWFVPKYIGSVKTCLFINLADDEKRDYLTDMYMLIAYKSSTLYIVDYHKKNQNPLAVYDVLLHRYAYPIAQINFLKAT